MTIGAIPGRIITEGVTVGSARDFFTRPEQVERNLRNVATMELANAKRKQGAESALAHYTATRERVSATITNLPEGVSVTELKAWQQELSDANAAIASFQSQLLAYQDNSDTARFRDQTYTQLSKWLGVSVDEIAQMKKNLTDKIA